MSAVGITSSGICLAVSSRHFSHAVGFDDAPFRRQHRGAVPVVGAVFCGIRLDGVLSGSVRRDGANATSTLVRLCCESRFAPQLQLILLQGIAFAGFNVVDVAGLHRQSGLPVVVVARRRPDLAAMHRALSAHVRGGERKWRLIEQAGPMDPVHGVFVQRAGLSLAEAESVLVRFSLHGNLPEPLRVAHIIAGGLALGQSRGRA
jgi:uncharacterized protein